MALRSIIVFARLIIVLLSFSITAEGASLLSASSDNRRSYELVTKLMKNYSKDITPYDDRITQVALGIYVVNIYSIREQEMDFSLSFYLRMSWKDPRLAFNPAEVNGTEVILLHDDMWEKLWIPDIAFRNEKSSRFHNMMFPNRLFHLKYDGELYISIKITAILSCPMDLHKYPFDLQKCPLTIQSITHPKELVIFKWMNETILFNKILSLPQFKLTGTSLSNCEVNIFSGRYPCAQIEFSLERDKRYYLLQIYIPSFLVVVLSWVSFWISMEAVPARVSIGLVTVLTMATQTNSVNKALPRVSYLKAIDVWMAICLVFVFGSLLEYSVVNVFSRRDHSRKFKKSHNRRNKSHNSLCLDEHGTGTSMETQVKDSFTDIEQCNTMPTEKNKEFARKVDKVSRILFPLIFLFFNIVYWPYYTT